ncbi:MAG: hypothetical protein ABGW92_05030 [Methanocaldococcus sp.]
MRIIEEDTLEFPKTEIDNESLTYYLKDSLMILEDYIGDYLDADDEFSRGVLKAFREMVILFKRFWRKV